MEKPLNIPILVRAIKRLTSEDENRHVRRITNRGFVTQFARRREFLTLHMKSHRSSKTIRARSTSPPGLPVPIASASPIVHGSRPAGQAHPAGG